MFDGLKKIFSKKKEPEKEQVSLRFDELRGFFDKRARLLEEPLQHEYSEIVEKIRTRFEEIDDVIKELYKIPVPEPRAKASESIKNRFCERSMNVLRRFRFDGIGLDFSDARKTYNKINTLIKEISISPKEVMHIKFFFTDHFNRLGSKITEVASLLKRMDEMSVSDIVVERKRISDMFDDIEKMHEKTSSSKSMLMEVEAEMRLLSERRNCMHLVDLSELYALRAQRKEHEKRIKKIMEIVNMNFGNISKVLKKIHHERKDEFYDFYVKQPFNAFTNDSNVRIREDMLRLLIDIKDGRLVLDSKSIDKVEVLMNNMEELVTMREESQNIQKDLDELRDAETKWIDREEKNASIEREIKNIDDRLRAIIQKKTDVDQTIVKVEDSISEQKNVLIKNIERLFGVEIELST